MVEKLYTFDIILNYSVCTCCFIRSESRLSTNKSATRKSKISSVETEADYVQVTLGEEEANNRLRQQTSEYADDWESVAGDLRTLGGETLGRTSGKAKPAKETWWWPEEIEQCIQAKKNSKERARRKPLWGEQSYLQSWKGRGQNSSCQDSSKGVCEVVWGPEYLGVTEETVTHSKRRS